MNYNSQFAERKAISLFRVVMMTLAGFVLVAMQSSTVLAQWTTGTNINNTNSGTVSVGTTSPGGDKLIVAGNTVGGNITSHTPLYSTYDSQNHMIMELGYGTATSSDVPFPSLVLSKNLTGTNNVLGSVQFANRNIADGNEKRLATIAAFSNGATNSGMLTFNTSSAGTINERMRINSAGNIGIGTLTPAGRLDVQADSAGGNFLLGRFGNNNASGGGALRVYANTASNTTLYPALELTDNTYYLGSVTADRTRGLTFRTGSNVSTGESALSDRMVIAPGGNVGVGLTNPSTKLHVAGGTRVDGTVGRVYIGTGAVANYRGLEIIEENPTTFSIRHHDPSVAWQNIAINPYGGNVGVGTLAPATKFHVVGDGTITGNFTVSGNIAAKYQDVAEWVYSSQQLSAGTVVVLDHSKSNQVIASSQAYDTRVAGVISLQPGITLGENGAGKVLVATTGRVRIKVDASRGAIQIGDLLVTSDVAGFAMKSQSIDVGGTQIHRPGTLVGKALEPLDQGVGEILVLLSLQ